MLVLVSHSQTQSHHYLQMVMRVGLTMRDYTGVYTTSEILVYLYIITYHLSTEDMFTWLLEWPL